MALSNNALIDFSYMVLNYSRELTEQTYIEGLIEDASSRINSYCQRSLKAKDYTIILNSPTYTSYIITPDYPINTITKLYIDSNHVFPSTTEVTDYTINSDNGIINLNSNMVMMGNGIVKLQYNAGFTTVPYDLQGATGDLVLWLITRRASNGARIGERATMLDGMNVSFENQMPYDVKNTLERYKRVR